MRPDERYVIGMDSSTQSVKAVAWTADGTPRAEGRAAHVISTPHPLHAEQDADDWWTAACMALSSLIREIDPARVDGIAISNQRETMVLLDKDRKPLAPATLWLDRRAKDVVRTLAAEIGAERLHAITGKPIDVIPCVYRLRFFHETQPDLLDNAAQILSVHDFLTQKLTGEAQASWTSGDPFGILDIEKKVWSREILDHLGIPLEKLPPLNRPGSAIGRVTAEAAAATGLRPGTPVFAGGGDGNCAGLGVNAINPGAVYLNLGTAVVGGGWSETPELSRYWRTLASPSGEGYLLESCQRGGAYFVNWLLDTFAGSRNGARIFERLEAEANSLGVGSGGVTVCSYLVGCMDPHWDENARASFTGMGPETGMGHLYRASMEAITLEFVRSLNEMRRRDVAADRVFVIGGGASSALWRQMVADSTGLPVIRSLSNEASALGAGMSAAVGAGWYSGFHAAADAMSRLAEQVDPDLTKNHAWAELSHRQANVYLSLRKLNR
ncbi:MULTISPECIES: xylulokinase [Rhizobium]|uniref:Xylulokinase protein n=3 Tax=Rhizobium TaxID=379 RepID=Q2K2B2_RHIEC|nr:xylulokinase protein [Rhizobium etli CFN 42]PDT21805.1 xylulose kinase [Rhizobium hidalgonense]PON08461.1 xylulose kinase [Rhizobium hidalgonense]UWU39030.1 FGGY-family carbohydrate kinase [Rhizobium leguminosarum bv. phaseoli]